MRTRGNQAISVIFGLVASAVARPAACQTVPDLPTCPRCSLSVSIRSTLATETAPGGLAGVPTQVSRDGKGRLWVVTPGELPLVFDPQGAFIAEVGRKGEGPGEYRGITALAPLPGDSILIVDARLQRASVLGPNLAFRRAVSLPVRGGATAVLRWPALIVMNSVTLSPRDGGWPLHFLDFSANVATRAGAFGDSRGEPRAGLTPALLRKLYVAGDGRFWASHVVDYTIAEYDAAGRTLRAIVRRPAFFRGESEWSVGSPTTPPPPFIDAVAARRDTLWVSMRVPRPDWRRAWSAIRSRKSGEISATRGPERTELYRSRVEVIDVKQARLVVAATLDGIVVHLDADGTAVVYDLDTVGTPRLRVAQLSIKRPGR